MNLPAHLQSKTMVQTTKKVNLTGQIPEGIRDEYIARHAALKATEQLIISQCGDAKELRGLLLSRCDIEFDGRVIYASVSYNVSVDGAYKKQGAALAGHIDASTMNLLLNGKILTLEEKRAFLAERNLIPTVQAGDAAPGEVTAE